MPSNFEWGSGGAAAGGSAVVLGTDYEGQAGARQSADGSVFPSEVIVGEGGCLAGGEAELGE